MASDEAEKSKIIDDIDNMINQGAVGLSAAYLHCKVPSIRK